MQRERNLILLLTLLCIAASPLALLVLLALPSDAFVSVDPTRLSPRILRALQNREPLVLTASAMLAAAALLGIALGRRRRWVGLYAGMLALAGLSYAIPAFQRQFPLQDVSDPARLSAAARILLGTDVLLSRFDPRTTLSVKRVAVSRARYPAVDFAFALEELPSDVSPERFVRALDAAGISKVVVTDARPNQLDGYTRRFGGAFPGRFVFFARPDFTAISYDKGIAEQASWVTQAARLGARGVRVDSALGLTVRDGEGKLVALDDPRLDPIWNAAASLGLPVSIETAAPPAFFAPIDKKNERFEELAAAPARGLDASQLPSFDDLMAQRERLLSRRTDLVFIGAHVGSNADDLARAAELIDRHSNYYVDISASVAALGREPVTAREFFVRYQDRILFATGGGRLEADGEGSTLERFYASHFEFLETGNEYSEYPLYGVAKQGNWRVYGLSLPNDVLEKIYVRNAERILPDEATISARLGELFSVLEVGRPIFSAQGPPVVTPSSEH